MTLVARMPVRWWLNEQFGTSVFGFSMVALRDCKASSFVRLENLDYDQILRFIPLSCLRFIMLCGIIKL